MPHMSWIVRWPVASALALVAVMAVGACGGRDCGDEGGPSEPSAAVSEQAPRDVGEAVRRVEAARTPSERRKAIQDIDEVAAVGNEDAIRVLEEALASEDRPAAEAAIDALELMETEEAAESLGAVLERSDDAELKLRSLDALSTSQGEPAARAAAIALTDPDAQVREGAVDALLLIDDPSAVQPLWQAYRGEQDEWVRELILDALESLGEDTERYRDED
jgi:HEAT repeat protein